MNPDGTGFAVLTEGHSPAWSPSKNKIAFVRGIGYGEIFTMNADGTNIQQITNSPNSKELDPAWSPDGKYIVYASNSGVAGAPAARLNLWTMKADGTAPVVLTGANNIDDMQPSWSSDFTKVAYARKMNSNPYRVWVVTLNAATRQATQMTQITPPQFLTDATSPAFSPDGLKIAFDYAGAGCGISIINADRTNLQPYTVGGITTCNSPTWSPSGAKLAFQNPTLWNGAIMTANLNGSGVAQETAGKWPDSTPAWSR